MPVFERPSPQAITKFGLAGGMGILGYDVSDGDYQAQYQEWAVERGYRLVDLWGYSTGGPNSNVPLFAFILEECYEHPSQFTQHMIAYADYQSVFNEQLVQGYAPVRVCVYNLGEETLVAAIFEQQGTWRPWQAKHDFLISDLPGHLMAVEKMGYRIRDLNAYSVLEADPSNPSGPKKWIAHFSSVWEPSDGRESVISMPASIGAYEDTYNQNTALGFYPVQISGYGPAPSFIGRWEKNPSYSGLWLPSSAAYQTAIDNSDLVGMRPASAGAFSQVYSNTPPLTTLDPGAFCGLWARRTADSVIPGLVSEFMKVYQIPGLSLAVAYQGKLAYAGGFGTADGGAGEAVQTTSTFRIASITKPITATAIFLLVAGNKLGLNDLVFGPRGRLSALGQPVDPRANLVTVRHLLQHTSGGWPNTAGNPGDPMFAYPGLNAKELITAVITSRALDNAPGTAFAYSNFGYCVLGRVIEQVTGDTYEDWVRLNILNPCHATMTIAGNTLADRQPSEVVYYGMDGDDPYSMDVARMDSHGGWVSTATDYLRFLVCADGLPTVPDLLPLSDTTEMTTPSELSGSDGYACGWWTSGGTWYHNGVLPGSRSFTARTADGFCLVALVNSGRTDDSDGTRDTVSMLEELMWTIRAKVDYWNAVPL